MLSIVKLYIIFTKIASGIYKIGRLSIKGISEMCILLILDFLEGYRMEKSVVNITKRKDGRYMGKFIVGYDSNGKALYQYVYGIHMMKLNTKF